MAATAERIRAKVRGTPAGSFVRTLDLMEPTDSRGAVDAVLHRLVSEGPLVPVTRGLYYKCKLTRFGSTRPDPLAVGYEIARSHGFGSGVGPSGYSAARALGLTTQVPSREEIAVPGRAPADTRAVHFTSRSPVARTRLRPLEIAILEMLRDWPRYSERTWSDFVAVVNGLAAQDRIDIAAISRAANRERHLAARANAAVLVNELAGR